MSGVHASKQNISKITGCFALDTDIYIGCTEREALVQRTQSTSKLHISTSKEGNQTWRESQLGAVQSAGPGHGQENTAPCMHAYSLLCNHRLDPTVSLSSHHPVKSKRAGIIELHTTKRPNSLLARERGYPRAVSCALPRASYVLEIYVPRPWTLQVPIR